MSVSSNTSLSNVSECLIKGIDDETEEPSTPKALIALKISFKSLFLVMIILSTIQYVINGYYQEANNKYEQFLIKAIESQDQIISISYLSKA